MKMKCCFETIVWLGLISSLISYISCFKIAYFFLILTLKSNTQIFQYKMWINLFKLDLEFRIYLFSVIEISYCRKFNLYLLKIFIMVNSPFFWWRVAPFWDKSSDGSGSKIFTRVGSDQFFDAQVGPGQPPKNLENFPQKPQFFPLGSKKVSSGQVKKYPGQGRVGPLFTAGKKYARVGSGIELWTRPAGTRTTDPQIPSLIPWPLVKTDSYFRCFNFWLNITSFF